MVVERNPCVVLEHLLRGSGTLSVFVTGAVAAWYLKAVVLKHSFRGSWTWSVLLTEAVAVR
jgi:hypothetical protein